MAKDRIVVERRAYNKALVTILNGNSKEVAEFSISVDTSQSPFTEVTVRPNFYPDEQTNVIINYTH